MRLSLIAPAILSALALAACGGGAAAPASSASAPASAAAKPPAASASVKPAASGAAASGKPAASGAAAASAKPGASGLINVKAAYSQVSAVQGALYLGADQKFFQKYGLNVDVTRISGTQQPPAMISGELQFGTPGGNELVSADLAGGSFVMIAAASNYPVFSLYGAKGANDIKDLKGKAIAVTTAGSSTDATAKTFLDHFGMANDVKIQPAATMEGILAVVEKGEVGGGIVSPPTTALAAKAGLKELVNGPKLGVPLTHSGVTVTRDYLKAHPDIVKAFLQGYYDAWKFALDPANAAAVQQTIVKWTKSDAGVAKDAYEYVLPAWSKNKVPTVDPAGIQNVLKVVDNPKAKSAKPADFIDNSILESIAK